MQPELIKAHGYIPEIHHVWTEDGYCLEMHRVLSPNDRVSSTSIHRNTIINNDTDITSNINKDYNLSSSSECNEALESHEACINIDMKLPVLVNHGLLSSSADWVLLGPHKALG